MILHGLSLQHFRNHSSRTLLFDQALTIIFAPNASGKTNILEAIGLLGTSESFRGATADDCVAIEQEYGRVKGKLYTSEGDVTLELLLTRGMVQGKRAAKKIYSVNDVKKTKAGFLGHCSVVSFVPEDLRLVTGSPPRRRQFLDQLLSQLEPEYIHALSTYEQSLKRRNKLLHLIKEGKAPHTTLTFWDQSLIKHGTYIQEKRLWLIEQLNAIDFPLHFTIHYDISVMSVERLAQYAAAELAVGHTLVGPHKDDIVLQFSLTTHHSPPTTLYPLESHGSRGQQRMGVLWLKLGAFTLLTQRYGHPPLLLLDDIFSELDQTNRERVLDLVHQTQTIMTTAEQDVLELKELQHAQIIRL